MIDTQSSHLQSHLQPANPLKLLRMQLDAQPSCLRATEHDPCIRSTPCMMLNKDVHRTCKPTTRSLRYQLTANHLAISLAFNTLSRTEVDQHRRYQLAMSLFLQQADRLQHPQLRFESVTVPRLHLDGGGA